MTVGLRRRGDWAGGALGSGGGNKSVPPAGGPGEPSSNRVNHPGPNARGGFFGGRGHYWGDEVQRGTAWAESGPGSILPGDHGGAGRRAASSRVDSPRERGGGKRAGNPGAGRWLRGAIFPLGADGIGGDEFDNHPFGARRIAPVLAVGSGGGRKNTGAGSTASPLRASNFRHVIVSGARHRGGWVGG